MGQDWGKERGERKKSIGTTSLMWYTIKRKKAVVGGREKWLTSLTGTVDELKRD